MDHAAHFFIGLAAFCGFADPLGLGVAATLFVAGLVGGFAHCGLMCGPFVLMQTQGSGTGELGLSRLAREALPFYHLGRLTTYAALGGLVGAAGGLFAEITRLRWPLAVPLLLAAAIFLYRAVARGNSGTAAVGGNLGRLLARLARPFAAGSTGHRGFNSYALGLLLGFLPCGMIYGALIAAGAGGDAWSGALAMGAFAIGTMPALIMVGLLGSLALGRWRSFARAAVAPSYIAAALALSGMAVALIV